MMGLTPCLVEGEEENQNIEGEDETLVSEQRYDSSPVSLSSDDGMFSSYIWKDRMSLGGTGRETRIRRSVRFCLIRMEMEGRSEA